MVQGLQTYNVFVANDFCGETVPLNVTSVSGSVTFFYPASKVCRDVMVTNIGPASCFIAFGLKSAGTVTAVLPTASANIGSTGATPILASAIYNFQKQSDNQQADTIAAICSGTGTCTIYITAVQGS